LVGKAALPHKLTIPTMLTPISTYFHTPELE
jgi:hypothetical protein